MSGENDSIWGEPDLVSDLTLDSDGSDEAGEGESSTEVQSEAVDASGTLPEAPKEDGETKEDTAAGESVPLAALIKERRKFQAMLEERDERYTREIEEIRKALHKEEPKPKPPEVAEAEELFRGLEHHPLASEFKAFLDKQAAEERQRSEMAALRAHVEKSIDSARETYSDFDELARSAYPEIQKVPGLVETIERSENPGEMLYAIASRMKLPEPQKESEQASEPAKEKPVAPPSVADVANRSTGDEKTRRSSIWGVD